MRRNQASAVRLQAALAEVEQLDLEGLRTRWQVLGGTPAPPSFRVGLLRAAVAYKAARRPRKERRRPVSCRTWRQ